MSTSGMTVDPKAIEIIKAVYKNQYAGCRLRINRKTQTVVVSEKSILPKDCKRPLKVLSKGFRDSNCRYAIVNLNYTDKATGGPTMKTALLMWSSESATVKKKMINTSTFSAVKNVLGGQGIAVEMCDNEEKSMGHILGKVLDVSKKEATEFEGKKIHKDQKNSYCYDSSDSEADSETDSSDNE